MLEAPALNPSNGVIPGVGKAAQGACLLAEYQIRSASGVAFYYTYTAASLSLK